MNVYLDESSTHDKHKVCTPTYYTLLKPASTAPETFQVQSLCLNFEGSGKFDLIANRTIPRDYGLSDSIGDLKNLTLKDYGFSLHGGDLLNYINFYRLQTLELINCAYVGYLFNEMLLDYKDYNLKKLIIQGPAFEQENSGYFGRGKLEQLLMLLNTGLEELTLVNFGVNRSSILAISVQGLTLQKLTMHESQSLPPSVQESTLSAADIRLLSKRFLRMQQLSVDLGPKGLTPSSATADILRQFVSLSRLGIALPQWDQSTLRDRASALAIFTNVASEQLKRLEIYSGSSYNESNTQHNIYKTLRPCWYIDRVGKDVVPVDVAAVDVA